MYDPDHPAPRWSTGPMRRVVEEPTLADAALRYANLGVPVFPCVPGGKQPLTSNGFHDATSSARIVHHWWQRNPEANIGLPTGVLTGLLVVDVDVHTAGSGYPAFERSRAAGLTEGWGWLVRTPSGGLHAYFPTTPEVEQRSWQVASAHVDFRGDGGYVIAPPSRIEVDGRSTTYDVIAAAHHPIQRLDAGRLRQFLEPPRRLLLRPDVPTIGARPDKLADWVASRPEGARNGGLFWAACRMVEHGHDYHESMAVLGAAAQTAGLPEREIESTISSAFRFASRLSPPQASPAASRLGPTRPTEGIAL
jgi:hypothetical protein